MVKNRKSDLYRSKMKGRWYIIQEYTENSLLISNSKGITEKFDIRWYGLFTYINSKHCSYFFQDGYLCTALKQYNNNNINDPFIHLTEDVIQNKCEDYGKYENGIKMLLQNFEKYLGIQNSITKSLEQNYLSSSKSFLIQFPQIKSLVASKFRLASK